jgi:hypothetical protein
MKLLLYLGDQLIDAKEVSVIGVAQHKRRHIQEQMKHLLTLHKAKLEDSLMSPTFFLEGVPSRINGFVALSKQLM